jgi:hypothetical protein
MFPDDWQIALHLLYHHIYETGNTRRAAEVAQHAATLERAPPYVGRLAATLMAKDKRYDAAVAYLTQLIEQSERPEVKNAYKMRLDELIAERDGVPNRSLSSTKKGKR